jgi:hypothetical protein
MMKHDIGQTESTPIQQNQAVYSHHCTTVTPIALHHFSETAMLLTLHVDKQRRNTLVSDQAFHKSRSGRTCLDIW